jgi:hypothetical protein
MRRWERGVRASCAGAGLLVGALALASAEAHAEIGSDRRPVSLFSPGATFEVGIDGSLRFGGEVAAAQYGGRWGLGGAVGFVPGRLYFEVQPARVLGDRPHNVVLGLNPGFTIDVTGTEPRYGGQLTLWGNYARAAARPWASPLFPFARVQAVLGMGFTITGGLMLKLPIPVR